MSVLEKCFLIKNILFLLKLDLFFFYSLKAEKCICFMFCIISNVMTHMKVMFFLIVLSWIKYHLHFAQILHLTSTISLVLIVFQDLKTKRILQRNSRAKEAVKRKLKNARSRVLLLKVFIIYNLVKNINRLKPQNMLILNLTLFSSKSIFKIHVLEKQYDIKSCFQRKQHSWLA